MDQRWGVLLGVLLTSACGDSPPGRTFYERNIEPILIQKCAGNTSGCHSTNVGDPFAFAAGNLDVTTLENIQKRRDVLTRFGAYQQPLLLIKAVAPALPNPADPNKLSVEYRGAFLPLDVLHAGGSIIDVSSDAYFTIQTWLENGATENGLKPATPARSGTGSCSTAVPSDFNEATYAGNANFATFKSNVQPILDNKGCSASNCHGAPQSDFYITCGQDERQRAFNFSQAWSFVNATVDDSQLLRVPLAVAQGGRGHTGGDQFASTTDDDYEAIKTWAQAVGKLEFADTPQKDFFEQHVQPVLLQRGCAFEACHSPAATNDFKLRSGTQGFVSAVALEKNYDLLKNEFMAIELPDARRGRAIAKSILADDYRVPTVGGIAHRGGAVIETPGSLTGSNPASCPPWTGNTPPAGSTPFCVVQEWITRERGALGAQVTSMNATNTVELVYVDRAAGQGADHLELDTYQGPSDLRATVGTFGADFGGDLTADATASRSLLGSCAGLTGGNVDVRAPDVANDGNRVAFAARAMGQPFNIYIVNLVGGACTQVTTTGGHNFDPAWSPDGQYLVFASTRGKTAPTLSRKRFLPQSDLWRIQITAANQASGSAEQMTFLSNSEIGPQFMREGRVTMTTEKASDGFYQLAGRRINWDLTDYHPLLAQRNQSPGVMLTELTTMAPSIGYGAATGIRESNDGNFLVILTDVGADGKPVVPGGGGALGVFNRSIGPFEQGRSDPGYLPSLRVIDGAATGRTAGAPAYRSPFYLPDGQIMASHTVSGTAAAWRVVAVHPRTGAQTPLLTPPGGRAFVDAVVAYKYPARTLYYNRRQLVFGGAVDPSLVGSNHSVLHLPDAPMAFTLLTANLRRGRPIALFRGATRLVVEEEGMCPAGACAANTNGVYQMRTMLGTADLASDDSVKVRLPSGRGVVLSLQDASGNTLVKMGEEHQLGPGEVISLGVRQTITNAAGQTVQLFDAVCGGCHGTVTGRELDVLVTPDALTGASVSVSQSAAPVAIGQ